MSSQVWALAGVVVGAILGGLAQIVNGWIVGKRDHLATLRQERMRAYAAFMAAVEACTNERVALDRILGTEERRGGLPQLDAYKASLQRVYEALGWIFIVAPLDTTAAASQTSEFLGLPSKERPDTNPDAQFITLAKRDLGVPLG